MTRAATAGPQDADRDARMRVAIVGGGYVGLCTGVVFASHGHDATIVDVVADKVGQIERGEAPFYEPGLPDALKSAVASGRLRATTDLAAAVAGADVTFLCVGTPQRADGALDLSFVRQAAEGVGRALRASPAAFHVVVTKSTVEPGTTQDLVAPTVALASGRRLGEGFGVASNPEFLREGSAMKDAFEPDRIVVGASDPRSSRVVLSLYGKFACPKLEVAPRTAEMIKYAANAFLAAKVGFSNEMANVCERIGVDWVDVARGIGHDPRIGPLFLRAGVGFGGSCFPKDVSGLAHLARRVGAPSPMLEAVLATNQAQPLRAVDLLREELGTLQGKRVALLGLAFKGDTDDVRETRALPIHEALREAGAQVVGHDPAATETFRRLAPHATITRDLAEALRGADGCVVQGEWSQYRDIPPETFLSLMRSPIVVDGRRVLDAERMRAAGVRLRAIGLGVPS